MMLEEVGLLIAFVLVFVGFFLYALISVLKENAEERRNPKKPLTEEEIARLRKIAEEERKNKKNTAKKMTKACAAYANKVNARNNTKQQIRFAVLCPNCGAPLEAIYCRCEYCGSAYKELGDWFSQKYKDNDEEDAT